jgi:hypothetical protein
MGTMGGGGHSLWYRSRDVNLLVHLHIVPRSRMMELYLQYPLRFHYMVLNELITETTLPLPRNLRHELSSCTQTLGSWVRISLHAMSVCVYSVFVVFYVDRGLATSWSMSKVPYRPCLVLRNWKGGQDPTKSSTAIINKIINTFFIRRPGEVPRLKHIYDKPKLIYI